MAAVNLRKGVAAFAVVVCASFCCASGPENISSLYLSTDSFHPNARRVEDIPPLETDTSTDENRVQYSLATGSRWDPKIYALSLSNCVILLGVSGLLGLGYMLRDRVFPYYR